MGTKLEACIECTHKCFLDHGNKKSASPVVASFFKIMIGYQFSKVLFLPPRFAPTVSALVGQKAVLEDSGGLQWKVTITRTDGSLAFQQGWNAFSLDHDIQQGEFLVFNHIAGSHFIVKIYDKSGCEKLKFPENRNKKKKTRDNRNSTVEGGLCRTIDKTPKNMIGSSNSVMSGSDAEISQHLYRRNDTGEAPIVRENASNCGNCNERPKVVPKAEYIEEMICMIDREQGEKQEKERTCIFDLSTFEMLTKTPRTGGSNKATSMDETCSHHDSSSARLRNEAGLLDKSPVAKEAVTTVILIDESCSHHDDASLGLGNEAVTTAIPIDESCSHHDDLSLRLGNEAGLVDENPVAREAMSTEILPDAPKFDRTEKNNSSEGKVIRAPSDEDSCTDKTSGHLFPTAAVNPEENEGNISNISNRALKEFPTADGSGNQVAVSGKEHDLIGESFQIASKKFIGTSESFDQMTKAIKIEAMELPSDPCSQESIPQINGESSKLFNAVCSQVSDMNIRENDRVFPVVKSEPVDPVETFSSSSNFSCMVTVVSQSYLELPVSFPTPMTQRGRHKIDRRVVFLRDPVMRLWPVVCIDKDFCRILTGGWEDFSKANNIQPGDECVFGVENRPQSFFAVHIIRKDGIHINAHTGVSHFY